jgi:hypothetical protein
MYPLVNWTYDQLCERLTLLKTHHLYPELVVVSAQLIEQVIKRHIMREMNLQRRHWDLYTKQWIPLTSPNERDEALRSLGGVQRWKTAWNKLLKEQKGLPQLDEAFHQVVGRSAWEIFSKQTQVPRLPGQTQSDNPPRYGLLACRHRIVHGAHSPQSNEIECLGVWGAEAITRILCPDQGWQQCLRWNAQEKMPPLRTRSTKS